MIFDKNDLNFFVNISTIIYCNNKNFIRINIYRINYYSPFSLNSFNASSKDIDGELSLKEAIAFNASILS